MVRAIIRGRRQITLPAKICRELALEVGDAVQIELNNGSLLITPSRKRALDALAAIQKAFRESGITEKELLAGGRQVRRELVEERYGHLRKA